MAWSITGQTAGAQQIDVVETVQRHNWGTMIDATDPVYGVGEFVYVKGVSGGFAGATVLYSTSNGLTTLTGTSGVLQAGSPVAVLMSALDGPTKYGWAQIAGDTPIKKTAVIVPPSATRTDVFLSATAGRIMPTSVASRRILGARFANVASVVAATSAVVVNLNRPHIQSPP